MHCARCGFGASPTDRFCACCGAPSAGVYLSPVEGIIMHDRPPSPPLKAANGGRSGSFTIERRGRMVDAEVEISLNRASVADFRLELGTEPFPPLSTITQTPTGWTVRLNAKGKPLHLRLQCLRQFPLRDVELTVRSLLPTEPARLMVVDGGNPRWGLSTEPIGVYPRRRALPEGAAHWVCALPLLDGVERVTEVHVFDAEGEVYEYAELLGPALPRLIQAGRAIEVALSEPPRDPSAPLTLRVVGQAGNITQTFQILHQSPVVLDWETVHDPAHGPGTGVMGVRLPLIVGLAAPTHVGVRLFNAGSAAVRLRGCTGPSFLRVISVRKREVEDNTSPPRFVDRKIGHGPARFPRDVDRLRLPNDATFGAGEWLDQLRLELASACVAQLSDRQLTFTLVLDLEYADGDRRDHELEVSLYAERARELNEDEGYLAVDFGTVNTCARLVLKGQRSQDIEFPGRTSRHTPKQLKSCYNVHLWHRDRKLAEATIGEEAWEERHHPSVDFVPKLRLGHAKKPPGEGFNPHRERRIFDQRGSPRNVDGVAAVHQILALVLERTIRQTGRIPRKLHLSHPVAFSAAAKDDLLAACVELGIRAEVEVPEPVAFLRGVLSDKDCCDDILAAADNWKHHHAPNADIDLDTLLRQRPMLGLVLDMGGGTTDVTVFHLTASDNVEVVANFGYNWFGGEALTLWIAQAFSETIQNAHPGLGAVFPPSERNPKRMWEALMGHQLTPAQRRYLAEVRRDAEDYKLGASDLSGPVHWVRVVAADGTPSTVRVEGENTPIADLPAHIHHFIKTGLDDIFERLGTMKAYNAIQTVVPGVVIIAGNAGRLRWLPEALDAAIKNQPQYDDSDHAWLNNPNGLLRYGPGRSTNPDFLSDAGGPWDTLAKIGVVRGMVQHDGEMTVDTKLADPRWWYLSTGDDTYTLALPSGTRPIPAELLATPQNELPPWLKTHRARGRTVETRLESRQVYSTLAWGRTELRLDEHPDVHLQPEGTITPPADFVRRRGEVAYGKDERGGFGAFMRLTEGGGTWTWVPCIKPGGNANVE